MSSFARSPRHNAAYRYLDQHLEENRADRLCLRLAEVPGTTYGELSRRVAAAARLLAAGGVGYRDRVVLVLPDGLDLVAAFFALLRLGAVAVPLSTQLLADEYAFVITDLLPRGWVVTPQHAALFEPFRSSWPPGGQTWVCGEGEAPASWCRFDPRPDASGAEVPTFGVSLDDEALIQYTSGSTGKPKGVVHLHRGLLALDRGFGHRIGLRGEDLCFSAAKLSFGYGLGNSVFFPFAVGAAALLHPKPVEPFVVYRLIERFRPTVFFGVPSLYATMLEVPRCATDYDVSSLRLCVSAGEHLSARLFERWQATFGHEIIDGIGATECLHIFISGEPGRIRPGSTGTTVPGYEAKLLAEDGEPAAPGEVGHLWIRGETNAAGYWNRHAATRERFHGPWVRTGDLFHRDDDGHFFFFGRSDDVIKVGGLKVAPVEIEARLLEHESVRECAVVGRTDAEGIVAVVAYVRLDDGWEPAKPLARELKRFVRAALAPHKCPRVIEFVAALPKTSTGKTARFVLRDQGAAAALKDED